MINVEVAYALSDKQTLISVQIKEGSTVEAAINVSGILQHYPEIDLSHCQLGISSQVTSLQQTLLDGDRIEIYQPLRIDPKEARRLRALKKASCK